MERGSQCQGIFSLQQCGESFNQLLGFSNQFQNYHLCVKASNLLNVSKILFFFQILPARQCVEDGEVNMAHVLPVCNICPKKLTEQMQDAFSSHDLT